MKTIDGDLLERTMMEMGSSEVGLDADYQPEICDGCVMAFMDLIHKANTLTLNTLRDAIYQDAVVHGLWEDADKAADELAAEFPEDIRPGEKLMFLRMEAARSVFFESDELLTAAEDNDAAGFVEELADVVIMCFSTAGKLGIDIDAAIRRKMKINKERPWKHGKE